MQKQRFLWTPITRRRLLHRSCPSLRHHKRHHKTTTQNSSRQNSNTTKASTSPTTIKSCETPRDAKLINAPPKRGRDDDALARFPNFQSPGGVLRGLDYAGTLTFSLTGSVTAAQSGLDVFGCSMLAMVTAVGGGTIRDAVFLAKSPFWTSETEYIWMTVMAGFVTFFAWPHVLDWQRERQQQQLQQLQQAHSNDKDQTERATTSDEAGPFTPRYDELDAVLDTFDAIGLAAFAIVGSQNGVRSGMPMVVSAVCGMATATFGGLTRDVLCGRPVRIVHSNAEAYAPLALAGAITYLAAKRLHFAPGPRIASAFCVCMGGRFLAVKHDVKLHTWDTKNDGLGVTVRK